MKYKETGFRAVYKQFCAFPARDRLKKIAKGFPQIDEANCILGYGYIDKDAGLTVEIIAGGKQDGDSFRFFDTSTKVSCKLRIGAVEEDDFYLIDNTDGALSERYADKLDMLKIYDVSDEIEETRKMDFLDSSRDPAYIDDVLVFLTRKGLKPEGCWARICGLGDHWIMGILLNEPDQNFGFHKCEKIAFFVQKQDDDSIVCYSDMTPDKELTSEDLEDGNLLKEAAVKFEKERTEENLFEVMSLLRDSFVWIPCNAVLSERDQKMWDELAKDIGDDLDAMIGKTVENQDEIRMIPDILQNGDDYFFPIFSSVDEMGEYGNGFSKVQKHTFEAISLAENNERELKGIVLNAFTDPFVLEAGLFDVLKGMKSRLVHNPENDSNKGLN